MLYLVCTTTPISNKSFLINVVIMSMGRGGLLEQFIVDLLEQFIDMDITRPLTLHA